MRGARRVLVAKRALPLPPEPPRAMTSSSPGAVRSATVSPVARSITSVPAGMLKMRSAPDRPLLLRPLPGLPGSASICLVKRKSVSVPSCGSTRRMTSPPLPPSPPSGPPRGTWASRRNEMTPRPPSPPRTFTRARSRNMRDLGERTDERADPDVRQRIAESLECGAHAARTFAVVRDERERAQRVGVEVAKHERRALGRIGRERDERLDLVAAIEEAGQRQHLYREREAQLGGEAQARTHIGEAVAVRSVDRVVCRRARAREAYRDRVEPGGGQTAQPARRGPVRLEVDRAVADDRANTRYRVFDLARGEERLALALATERDHRAAAGEMLCREARDLLGAWMERRGFRRLGLA